MKSKEKIPIDEIQKYINEDTAKHEDDLNQSPLKGLKRELIIPEAENLFEMFRKNEIEAAVAKLKEVLEKIDKIEDMLAKNDNLRFVRSFDQKINPDLKSTKELNEQ